jgi:predicted metal-binding membrane protein
MRAELLLYEFRTRPWPALFALSGLGLFMSAWVATSATVPGFCGIEITAVSDSFPAFEVLGVVLTINPPSTFVYGWSLMLLAMMPPLLAFPLAYIAGSTFSHRSALASMCFSLGYGLLWLAFGIPLTAAAILLWAYFQNGATYFVMAALCALIWSGSPLQQMAINRGHRVGRIGAFGWRGHCDAFRFGVVHAKWCIASCWLWMLLPMLSSSSWHVPMMAVSGVAMLAERIAPLGPPRWKTPPLLTLLGAILLPTLRQHRASHA